MDQKLFKEFIQSVAVIKEQEPEIVVQAQQDLDLEDEEDAVESVEPNSEYNPTLGFKFISLKPQHRACELGCGNIVADQLLEKRFHIYPVKHWRTRCTTCDHYVGPEGKTFIKGGGASQAAYARYFRELLGQPVKNKKSVKPAPDIEVTEYQESRPNKWITDSQGVIKLRSEHPDFRPDLDRKE
jgi:hypothetical protein